MSAVAARRAVDGSALRHVLRRVRVTLAVAFSVLAIGCGPAEPLASPDHAARREQLRSHLRDSLGESYDVPLPVASTAELAHGAELWELLCASCHGMTGRGTRSLSRLLPVEPGNLTDPDRAAFFSDRAKLRIVSEGSEGTPMIGWEDVLLEDDMRATIAHLRTLVAAGREQP